jgi:hypothetical protein
MKEYALIYRSENTAILQASPEQMAAMMQRWKDWLDHLKNKGQLASQGIRLERASGKVVKPNNVITNGPFAEVKETLGGFSIVKAASLEAASEIAKGCPILNAGGNVEVREVANNV